MPKIKFCLAHDLNQVKIIHFWQLLPLVYKQTKIKNISWNKINN